MSIQLNTHQQAQRQQLETFVTTLRAHFEGSQPLDFEQIQAIYNQMAPIAHDLHMSLTPHPTHHGYMIENRGFPADHPEFYDHFHPVQDLLAYLDDPTANDDPVDQTIGNTFNFRVYTRRWGHEDTYFITRTPLGWNVQFHGQPQQGDFSASPALEDTLTHDSVSYPRNLGVYMSWLWQQAKDQGLSANQVQAGLDELANWVSECEQNAPHHGLFQGI